MGQFQIVAHRQELQHSRDLLTLYNLFCSPFKGTHNLKFRKVYPSYAKRPKSIFSLLLIPEIKLFDFLLNLPNRNRKS